MFLANNISPNGHAHGKEAVLPALSLSTEGTLCAAIDEIVGVLSKGQHPSALTHTSKIARSLNLSAITSPLPSISPYAIDRYAFLHLAQAGWAVMAYVDSQNFAERYAENHHEILVVDRSARRILGPAVITIG